MRDGYGVYSRSPDHPEADPRKDTRLIRGCGGRHNGPLVHVATSKIVKNPRQQEPSKPSKPGFVGFDDSVSRESQKIQAGFDGFVGSDSSKTQKIDASGFSDFQKPRDAWGWIEERASIFEFEAGMDRETANVRAFELWFDRFVG